FHCFNGSFRAAVEVCMCDLCVIFYFRDIHIGIAWDAQQFNVVSFLVERSEHQRIGPALFLIITLSAVINTDDQDRYIIIYWIDGFITQTGYFIFTTDWFM